MSAQERLREGGLEEELAELQQQVRQEPASAPLRVFLVQLLAVLGRWERARAQMEALAELDAGARPLVDTYGPALAAEAVRASVFSGQARPPLIGEPEEWMAWLLEALRLGALGEHAGAAELRARAFEAAPPIAGAIDGAEFAWIADADARLGPMLEVIVNGRYAWLPFQRLRAARFEAPSDLRDLLWTPAYLTLETGAEVPALIPTRYVGSESAEDAIRLCRRTEWRELGAGSGCWAGLGPRMLTTDRDEYPLMDVRDLRLGRGDLGSGLEQRRGSEPRG